MTQVALQCFLLLILMTYKDLASSRPYIDLNTRDSWFSHQQKKIAWKVYESTMCVLPLNTTLSLIDCGNNGQVIKSTSTKSYSISIESADFNHSTNFYAISSKDSVDNPCGEPFYFHIDPYVQSEIQMVSEGGELCINIDFEPPILAFWPREIGSARNCYCSVLFRDFSDCYCISLQLTEYTVIFNTSTSELCWKNLNFAMNGSIVGIVREESPDCGDQPHLTARTYLKIIVILVEENISTSVSSSIIAIKTSTIQPLSPSVMAPSATQVVSSHNIDVSHPTDKNVTILISAGISSLVTIFVLATLFVILVIVLVKKRKERNSRPTTNDHPDPVYESPRFSLEVPEPLYEDITLPPIATATETVVLTEPNEAYTTRRVITKHVTVHNIELIDNEAYAVRKTTKKVAVQSITMEENEAYQPLAQN